MGYLNLLYRPILLNDTKYKAHLYENRRNYTRFLDLYGICLDSAIAIHCGVIDITINDSYIVYPEQPIQNVNTQLIT